MRKNASRLALAGALIAAIACGRPDLSSIPALAGLDKGSVSATAVALPPGTWRLVAVRANGQAEQPVTQPELFTAEFSSDGRASLRADCNRCLGIYKAGRTTLSVGPMACTRAFCTATAPLDSTYQGLVSQAQTWNAPDDQHLELTSDEGSLRFSR
jgi:heat shock protein HslJ